MTTPDRIREAVVSQGASPLILADPYLTAPEFYSYAEALEKVAAQLFDECVLMNEALRHTDKAFENYRAKSMDQLRKQEEDNAELKNAIKDLLDFKYGAIIAAKELL